ncbi:hypothetical protein [Litorisediminicola beolgyonensis]|uniref:Uncharacterized protein n=1 Tax=Litorisediminicola beolgyonensis TaxID=1173614 RepID=A0ABW3ZEU7_9RHOB
MLGIFAKSFATATRLDSEDRRGRRLAEPQRTRPGRTWVPSIWTEGRDDD